jgi:hypothetical protein
LFYFLKINFNINILKQFNIYIYIIFFNIKYKNLKIHDLYCVPEQTLGFGMNFFNFFCTDFYSWHSAWFESIIWPRAETSRSRRTPALDWTYICPPLILLPRQISKDIWTRKAEILDGRALHPRCCSMEYQFKSSFLASQVDHKLSCII